MRIVSMAGMMSMVRKDAEAEEHDGDEEDEEHDDDKEDEKN